MNNFNEATRVQVPALVHLTRIGYEFIGKIKEENAGIIYDADTNILINEFRTQFEKLNPEHKDEYKQVYQTIRQELNYDDLGKAFYKRLKSVSPIRLIDFDHPENNTFQCTAEFTCKNMESQDNFRPDITLFVNGLPLCFIEVKKPNNHGGMLAESKRMNLQRLPNKKFRRFINLTQLMIFSNNMEYDKEGGIIPTQGVFYCTGARENAPFNCFREENPRNEQIAPYNRDYPYRSINPDVEKQILTAFNCQVIKHNPAYQTNLNINTPTNRVITSMCSPERLLYILRYGIAYVNYDKEVDGKIQHIEQKQIMRYQQLFATYAVTSKLDEGIKSGIIWHTQGSGKTALSYYLTYILNDYFSKKNIVARFFFIVDRIQLLRQAQQEFESRGLKVTTANTKAELMKEFRSNYAQKSASGEPEITVVNIQRFAEDKEKVELPKYATNLQRVFILDEAHRGYKPGGCFLANLFDADKNSIKLALTGTPLLAEERSSCKVFGNYIHTYYYDRSIEDGYTLKIIREEIETSYREKLSDIQDHLEQLVQKKEITKSQIIEHPSFVRELLRYIIKDMNKFRDIQGDKTLGGMIIAESSEQARRMFAYFDEVQEDINATSGHQSRLKAGLILNDYGDKDSREQTVANFKKNMTVDILIVFNMLLTGFDAPRLKRLYFGRQLKDHNLLQAITRVNRPYKNNRYGFVVDFADIKRNFEETNEAYLQELNKFNDPEQTGEGNNTDTFQAVIENPQELIKQMKDVRQKLFDYTTSDVETFSTEISTIEDKKVLLDLKNALVSAKDCSNIVRTFGDNDLKEEFQKIDLPKIPEMIREVQRHIDMINMKEAFDISDKTKQMVSDAMADIQFTFSKIGEDELKIASQGELQEKWSHAIHEFTENIDPDDPEYITLREAFMKRFKEHGFVIDSLAKYDEESKDLDDIIKRLQQLQLKNNALLKKYNGDAKFARVHKRIREENRKRQKEHKKPLFTFNDEEIMDILKMMKTDIDNKVYDKNDILKKDAYFEQTVLSEIAQVLYHFPQIEPQMPDYKFIQDRVARQYINQYNATYTNA